MPVWSRLLRWVLLGLIVMATLATAVSGLRSYRSFLLLQSAYELGAPDVSNVRAWMTLRYVSHTYEVSETALPARLRLAPETDPDTSLKSLAKREGQSPFEYVQRVQRAVAEVAPVVSADRRSEAPSWLGTVGDEFLAALIVTSSLRLLREALHGLMEGVPLHLSLEEIGRAMAAVQGVTSVHDLHIWSLSAERIALSAHVVLKEIAQWQSVLASLQAMLRERFGIEHVTLQPEPAEHVFQPLPRSNGPVATRRNPA